MHIFRIWQEGEEASYLLKTGFMVCSLWAGEEWTTFMPIKARFLVW